MGVLDSPLKELVSGPEVLQRTDPVNKKSLQNE